GDSRGEAEGSSLERPGERPERGMREKPLQPVAGAETIGHVARKWLELGDVVFTQAKYNSQQPVALQRVSDLAEEIQAFLLAGFALGKQLLELLENKYPQRRSVAIACGPREALEEFGQSHLGELLATQTAIRPAVEGIKHRWVTHCLRIDTRRQGAGDSCGRRDLALLFLFEHRDEAGVDEGCLANARLGIKQHHRMRYHQRRELIRL